MTTDLIMSVKVKTTTTTATITLDYMICSSCIPPAGAARLCRYLNVVGRYLTAVTSNGFWH